MEIELNSNKADAQSKNKKEYGKDIYRINDPKKFQNEMPIVINEYQSRKIVRIPPVNSSANASFVGGNTMEFVIKGHEYINFQNSVIHCELRCAATPAGATYINLPYNTCAFIKKINVYVGPGDPIEFTNEYGLKEQLISQFTQKSKSPSYGIEDSITLREKALDTVTATDVLTADNWTTILNQRYQPIVAYAVGPPITGVNGDITDPDARINRHQKPFDIMIPLNTILNKGGYINLYNISDEGIRISLELAAPNTIIQSDAPDALYWLINPRLELDTITTTSENRKSLTPYTFHSQTAVYGERMWHSGSSFSLVQQTHNVSLTGMLIFFRNNASLKTAANRKGNEHIHAPEMDLSNLITTVTLDDRLYPYNRPMDSIPIYWNSLQAFLKQYKMENPSMGNDLVTSFEYGDSSNLLQAQSTGALQTTSYMHSVIAIPFDSWPQEEDLIDGTEGRNRTIMVNFETKDGESPAEDQLISFWLFSDAVTTINNNFVKVMNK